LGKNATTIPGNIPIPSMNGGNNKKRRTVKQMRGGRSQKSTHKTVQSKKRMSKKTSTHKIQSKK
jgi:hypothetical protein